MPRNHALYCSMLSINICSMLLLKTSSVLEFNKEFKRIKDEQPLIQMY